MRVFVFSVMLALLPGNLHAAAPDSLQIWLNRPGQADSVRVRYVLARAQQLTDRDSALAEVPRMLLGALALARRSQYVTGELEALQELGVQQGQNSDFGAALRYFAEGLRRARQTGRTRLMAAFYARMGTCYYNQQDLGRAADLFRQAIKLSDANGFKDRTLAGALAALALCYRALNQPGPGQAAFQRALALSRAIGDQQMTFHTLASWGEGVRVQQPDSAVPYLQQALVLAAQMRNPYAQAYASKSLMQTRQQQKRWPETLAQARQTLRFARLCRTPDIEAEALNSLAEAMRHLGQAPAAFDTLQRAHTLLDTLFSQEKRAEFARQQVAFEVGEKEARIRKLEQQRRIGRLEADRQTARNRLLVGGLAALVLLLTAGGLFYVRLRRTSAALATSEVQARQAEAAARTAETQALAANTTKDQLMSIIGHDLRGPVASFQQLTPVLQELVPAGPDAADAHRLLASLAGGARHLGELLDNLLRWARTEGGQTVNHPAHLPLAGVAASLDALLQPAALAKGITLTVAVTPPELRVWADPDLLNTVLRNLLTNALKFTPAGGRVGLHITADGAGRLDFQVTDTGVGIAHVRLAGLLEPGPGRASRGTAGEPGTGLGLPLSARFVRLLGGELVLESAPGEGTRARFELAHEARGEGGTG